MAYGLKPPTTISQGLAAGVQGFMQGRQIQQEEDDRAFQRDRIQKADARAEEDRAYQRARTEKADARADEEYNHNLGLRSLQEETKRIQLNEARRKLEQEGMRDLWRYARSGMLDEAAGAFNATGKERIEGIEFHPDDPSHDLLILKRGNGQAATIDLRKLDQMFRDPKEVDHKRDIDKMDHQHKNKLKEIEAEQRAKARAEGGLGLTGPDGKPMTINNLDLLWRRTFNFPDEQTLQNMELMGQAEQAAKIRQKMSENPLTDWVYRGYGVDIRPAMAKEAPPQSGGAWPWQQQGLGLQASPQGAGLGFQPKPPQPQQSTSAAGTVDRLPTPKTAQEAAAIPPGTRYVAPDGTIRIKQ